jgi:hypothetical protein
MHQASITETKAAIIAKQSIHMNQGVSKKNLEKLQQFLIKKQNEIHNVKPNNQQARNNTAKPRTA